MKNDYYIPLTIDEVVSGLKGIVKESTELTGQELIIGLEYVDKDDNEYDIPPGSIAVFLRQNTLNPEEARYGTIVLTPVKAKTLM